jgi:hypothetical protein
LHEFHANNVTFLFNGKKVCYTIKDLKTSTVNYIDALKFFVTDNNEKMRLENFNEIKSLPQNCKEVFKDTGLHIINHAFNKTLPGKTDYWNKISGLF